MKNKQKEWFAKRYQESKIAYAALMRFYPLTLTDLPGENWREVEYYSKYKISTFGRLLSFHKGVPHIVKPYLDTKGYLYYRLSKNGKKKACAVHTLVANAFIPNPDNLPEVNHEDGNRFNNCVDNLKRVTLSENRLHAYRIGLQERRYNAKLTDEQVRYVREVYKPYDREFGSAALARKFQVSERVMHDTIHQKRYKNIS